MALKKQTIGSSAKTIPKRKKTAPPPKRTIGKAGNTTPPPMTPGRTKPPVVKPIAPTPAPVKPDFNAWYQTDPRYLLQHPQFEADRVGTYAQFGWHPVLDAAGKPVLDAQGKPQYRQASAQEDPGSIVNQLAQALAGQSQNIQDSANSRGLLFSGAQAQGQQNALAANDQKLSEAQLAFQRALSGINTEESNLVNSLYPDYLATAPPATPPKPPAPAPVAVAPKKPIVTKKPAVVAPKKTPVPKRSIPKYTTPRTPPNRIPLRPRIT